MMFTAVLWQGINFNGQTAYEFDDSLTIHNQTSWISAMTNNGSDSTVAIEGYNMTLGVDTTMGFYMLLIAVIAIALVAGFNLVGTGWSDVTVKLIVKGALFYGLWGILSLLGIKGFEIIPFGFGWLMYLFMTLVFTIGVADTI